MKITTEKEFKKYLGYNATCKVQDRYYSDCILHEYGGTYFLVSNHSDLDGEWDIDATGKKYAWCVGDRHNGLYVTEGEIILVTKEEKMLNRNKFREKLILTILENDLLKVKSDILTREQYARQIVDLADQIINRMEETG